MTGGEKGRTDEDTPSSLQLCRLPATLPPPRPTHRPLFGSISRWREHSPGTAADCPPARPAGSPPTSPHPPPRRLRGAAEVRRDDHVVQPQQGMVARQQRRRRRPDGLSPAPSDGPAATAVLGG